MVRNLSASVFEGWLWRTPCLPHGKRYLCSSWDSEFRAGLCSNQPAWSLLQGLCLFQLHQGQHSAAPALRRRRTDPGGRSHHTGIHSHPLHGGACFEIDSPTHRKTNTWQTATPLTMQGFSWKSPTLCEALLLSLFIWWSHDLYSSSNMAILFSTFLVLSYSKTCRHWASETI